MVFISLTLEVKVWSSGLPLAQETQICWILVLYVSYGFGGNHIYIHVFFMMCVTKSRHVFCQNSPYFLLSCYMTCYLMGKKAGKYCK
jgi:hypothetical protein